MDEKNRRILGLLQQNARVSIKTIAAKVGLARSSVRERIARMEASGLIRAYRVELARNGDAAAVEAFLLIRLDRTPAPQTIARIVAQPAVVRCSSVGGDLDVIVEVRTPDVDALNRLRDEMASYPHVMELTTASSSSATRIAAASRPSVRITPFHFEHEKARQPDRRLASELCLFDTVAAAAVVGVIGGVVDLGGKLQHAAMQRLAPSRAQVER
ncbi:MAG: Lrp/AsnC family transcriptional regulator [Gammaproteobacteria bacterium]|nr:Lrp/AsnC family transcriptional regulator [Gammaproteobacteria bacterium]